MEDVEEAITFYREALTLCPLGQPDSFAPLNKLSCAVLTRFQQWDRMEDLEEAIECYHEILTLCPAGHPYYSSSLIDVADKHFAIGDWSLWTFGHDGRSITYYREALTLGHPARVVLLIKPPSAVFFRSEALRKMEDREEAVIYNREALKLFHDPQPHCYDPFSSL